MNLMRKFEVDNTLVEQGECRVRLFDIFWYEDHYELWIDGTHVDDFRTYIEAINEADRVGATKRPRRPEPDETDCPPF